MTKKERFESKLKEIVEIDEEYWFKDYGKTWALTREELL